MIKIHEIFLSIQGESSLAGYPTVFVRLSGCHLRCTYCDTTHAYYEGEKESLDQILNRVAELGAKHVCVTGGEPLLQPEVHALLTSLCDRGHIVSLETSGDLSCAPVDSRVRLIIDVKTPGSGEGGRFSAENLQLPDQRQVEFKFVICSAEDFIWAEEFARQHRLFQKYSVLYSPSFTEMTPKNLAEKILSARSPARLQLQLHKYIWSPETRGV